jgi:hypothetical protein
MVRSIAELCGTILYIDGRPTEIDMTPDEAAEYIAELQSDPRAPLGVRIVTTAPRIRQPKKKA